MVVAGSGLGFVPAGEQMHFTYQSVRGDVDIVARLREIVDPHPLAVAGVMVRGSLDADASYAAITSASQLGVTFTRRLARGWTRIDTAASPSASWFRLERRGALVSAFVSANGSSWQFVGSDLVNLDDEVHVGLLAASHQAGTLSMAVFDRLDVRDQDPMPADLRYLVFEPSPDHELVTGYLFELAQAGAPQGTVLERDIGKPPVVNGECRIDVSALLALLPSGIYVARVRAAGELALSPPGVSAPFPW